MTTVTVTDAAFELLERLHAKGINTLQYIFRAGPARVNVPQPPQIGDTRVVSVSEMRFDKKRELPLPVSSKIVTKIIRNCADTTLNSTIGISVTAAKGWRATKTRTLATTTTVKTGGRFDTKIYGDYSLDVTWQQSISIQDQDEKSASEQIVININDVIVVKPWTAIRIEAKVDQVGVEVPFSVDAIVDAAFVVPGASFDLPKGVVSVSQFLNESERTFTVAGILRIDDASSAAINIEELKGELACGEHAVLETFIPEITLPASALSDAGKTRFKKRERNSSLEQLKHEGPGLGPPDGIHYEVLYTIRDSRLAMQCEINDAGLPGPAWFETEYRRYSEYRDGDLVRQWEDSEEKFIECISI